jgi:elongation factor G
MEGFASMKEYAPRDIRNLALIAHGGTGKTSLSEAMLFNTGVTNRLGRVDDGNTASDYDPDEVKRKNSINLSLIPCEWNGTKLNVLDTPGYADFVGEEKAGLRAADFAVILVDAQAGVQVGTEYAWLYANERNLPRAVVVNRIDRENTDFDTVLSGLQEQFGKRVVAIHAPIGTHESFSGVVDICTGEARTGEKGESGPVPGEMADAVATYRDQLIEAVAETDDDLITKYLEGEEIGNDELCAALRKAVAQNAVTPVFVTSATRNIGVAALMDALIAYAPSPLDVAPETATTNSGESVTLTPDPDGPLAALVFKSTADPFTGRLTYFRVFSGALKSDSHVWNANKHKDERVGQVFFMRGQTHENATRVGAGDIAVVAKLAETGTGDTLCDQAHPLTLEPPVFPKPSYSAAVTPKTRTDSDKIGPALQRIIEEDHTLQMTRDPDTHEIILSGVGESHIQVTAEKMQRKFGVGMDVHRPRVPYRESITAKTQAEYKHKKQTGGAGQYGHVFLELEPLPRGTGFEFSERVVGGSVPREFFPAVEKGVREALREGVLGHYPISDMRVTLFDGSFHPVDSKAIAFELAAQQAVKKGMTQGHPVLLEPVMRLRVRVPDANTGDVLSDLNGNKRAKVGGMIPEDGFTVVEAEVPLAEIQDYSKDVRALTQGRGSFEMEFDHYAEVPQHLAQKIVEQAQKEREAVGAH